MKHEPYLSAALTYSITLAIHRGDTIADRTTRDIATITAWRHGVPIYVLAAIDCVHRVTVHRRMRRAAEKTECNTLILDGASQSGSLYVDAAREVSPSQDRS